MANDCITVAGLDDNDKIYNIAADGKIHSYAISVCGQAQIVIQPDCILTANIGGKNIKIKVELD